MKDNKVKQIGVSMGIEVLGLLNFVDMASIRNGRSIWMAANFLHFLPTHRPCWGF